MATERHAIPRATRREPAASTDARVTIVAMNFAPEPTGSAPYTTRMAEGLAARGHAVTVVTAFPHYPEWRVPAEYRGQWARNEFVHGLRVTRVRQYVPKRPTYVRRALAELSFGLRATARRWHEADVVLCASPALLATGVAVLRSRAHRRPAVGVVVQDLYSAGVLESGALSGRAASTMTGLEALVLRQADGVVVIHDRFKARLVDELGVPSDRVDVVRNWTHIRPIEDFDRASHRARLGWGSETVVLHTGAMGDKQGLENVVDAARLVQATGAPIRFVLVGNGGRRRALEQAAAGCAAIDFHDPLPDGEFGRALRSADVLLVNERSGSVEAAVPSKLTSYFTTGIPVLAATDEGSTTAEELIASGAGARVPPGDPQALITGVLRLREDRTLWEQAGSRGPAYCDRLLSEDRALDAYDAWVRKLYRRKHGDDR